MPQNEGAERHQIENVNVRRESAKRSEACWARADRYIICGGGKHARTASKAANKAQRSAWRYACKAAR